APFQNLAANSPTLSCPNSQQSALNYQLPQLLRESNGLQRIISTTIWLVVAVSCSLITIIPNICRSFHVTCSSASPPETKAGTRWCRRTLPRSSAGAVSLDTRNDKAA